MQTTSSILMIRPVNFAFNEQTASTNPFQHRNGESSYQAQEKALAEFNNLAEMLIKEGINVIVFDDTKFPKKPDSIFPNNWVSFHEDGSVVIYPMYAQNRRLERRRDIIESLGKSGFNVKRIIDFCPYENHGKFLEGTGSLVLDRKNKIAYSCLSPRTNAEMQQLFAKELGYKTVAFSAIDENNKAIYHTNVMMSIGEGFAVICKEAITNKEELSKVLSSLKSTGHEIIDITMDQFNNYAGNMLQLQNKKDEKILAISQHALESLNPTQVKQLKKHSRILSVNLDTIEKYGGGSARCMLAEVFLPRKE